MSVVTRVIAWGEARGLYKESTAEDQYDKCIEELGELFKASNGEMDRAEYLDAIGDIFVCLVHVAHFQGVEIVIGNCDCALTPTQLRRILVRELANIDILKGRNYAINRAVDTLGLLAIAEGLRILEVVEDVLDVIELRKGRFIDGKYVKDV